MTDLINACFEAFSAIFILNNVRVLHRDKMARGVSKITQAFLTFWGLWNLYYYPSLGQTLSFYAGIAIVLSNALYLSLLWRYRKI